MLEAAFEEIEQMLVTEILEKLKNGSPSFFERLVVDLLLKMVTAGLVQMPAMPSAKVEMKASMGLLKKINWGWTLFISRRNAGKTLSVDQKYKSLWVLW